MCDNRNNKEKKNSYISQTYIENHMKNYLMNILKWNRWNYFEFQWICSLCETRRIWHNGFLHANDLAIEYPEELKNLKGEKLKVKIIEIKKEDQVQWDLNNLKKILLIGLKIKKWMI